MRLNSQPHLQVVFFSTGKYRTVSGSHEFCLTFVIVFPINLNLLLTISASVPHGVSAMVLVIIPALKSLA